MKEWLLAQWSSLIFQLFAAPEREKIARVLVQKAPQWFAGHLIVAKAALRDRRSGLAYGGAQILILHARGALKQEGLALQARVFLQTGRAQEARDTFEQLSAEFRARPAIREDLAGAILALGDRDGARAELLRIPEELRSSEALSALSFLSIKSP